MLHIFGVPLAQAGGHETAYALLSQAYSYLYGDTMPRIKKTELGKPYFASGPVHFSITHTKTMVFCAISEQPVGLDAETIRQLRPRIAERTMNQDEQSWIASQPDAQTAFLKLWTVKEAWVKLTGTGLRGRPKDVAVQCRESALGIVSSSVHILTREVCGVIVTACIGEREPSSWTIWEDCNPSAFNAENDTK